MLVRNSGPVEAHWAKYKEGKLLGLLVSIHSSRKQFEAFCSDHIGKDQDGCKWKLELGPDAIDLSETKRSLLEETESVANNGHVRFDLRRYA